MVEFKGDIVGKINVEYKDKSALYMVLEYFLISEVRAIGKQLLVVIFLYV